jgi:amidohydrolase
MALDQDLVIALDAAVDACGDELDALACDLHAHPELRFEEHRAAATIGALLERHGHVVERGLAEMSTSFRARSGSGAGPRLAILAEYDALPEIGHACGHNLIAASAVGAFLALAPVAEELGATFELVGTPAEEGGGGKCILVDQGVFEGVDAALMFHPFDRDLLAHPTLANLWIQMDFHGVPAHAAAAPWDGQSALTACMQTFSLIDSQRVHFRDGVRVHGYITNGGQAVNIIPERAGCEFSVRARTLDELARVRAVVERCARAAAMACGVEVTLTPRRGYKDMRNNLPLARAFGEHLRALGRAPRETDDRVGTGSTDMGDVSHAVPAVHVWLAICDENATLCHQHAFADAAKSARGVETMAVAAKALARTAAAFVADAALRASARDAFAAV